MSPSADHGFKLQSSVIKHQLGTDRYEYRGARDHCFDIEVAAAGHLQRTLHGSFDDWDESAVRVLGIEFHCCSRRLCLRQFYFRQPGQLLCRAADKI